MISILYSKTWVIGSLKTSHQTASNFCFSEQAEGASNSAVEPLPVYRYISSNWVKVWCNTMPSTFTASVSNQVKLSSSKFRVAWSSLRGSMLLVLSSSLFNVNFLFNPSIYARNRVLCCCARVPVALNTAYLFAARVPLLFPAISVDYVSTMRSGWEWRAVWYSVTSSSSPSKNEVCGMAVFRRSSDPRSVRLFCPFWILSQGKSCLPLLSQICPVPYAFYRCCLTALFFIDSVNLYYRQSLVLFDPSWFFWFVVESGVQKVSEKCSSTVP